MGFKCDLCNLTLSDDAQFKQHLEGKKHKRLESIKEERNKSSLRSLFVSGLKKDVFVKHLEEYFQKYGKIHKIIIDKDKKAYAIIEFENESSVNSALSVNEHKINEKLVKVKRRMTKEFVSKIANNSEKKKDALEKSKKELIAMHEFLTKCTNFHEQVAKFIDYTGISEQELENRKQVCNELNTMLKKHLPNSNVEIFGSTNTGLATNGSDMDVTILLDNYLELNKHKQLKPPKKNGSLKSQTSSNSSIETDAAASAVEMIAEEQMNEQEEEEEYLTESQFEEKLKNLLNLELDEQISIVTKLIQRYTNDFQDIRKVTNSRCPVIKFEHEVFKTSCDITLNNYLAVQNTKLIQCMLAVEPMLKSLIYIVRYWSKQKGLNGTFKFNSYTLIWLIVFYLQKINRLPTIDFLAKLKESSEKKLIHGWDCSFEDNPEKIKEAFKPSENSSDFNDLLKGFFDFYAQFQFSTSFVLSTRTGTVATNDNSLISKKGVINIQDPFDLEHNLAGNINEATLERFKTECSQANSVLKYCLTPHKASEEKKLVKCWGLSMLFTRKTPEMMAPKEHVNNALENGIRIKLNLNNNNYDKNIIGVKETEFVSNLLNSCLLFEVAKENGGAGATENYEVKRKRIPVLNQICTKVDSLGLNCSPKRLRVSDEPDKYFYMEEKENKVAEDDDDDDDEFKCHESLKHLSDFNVMVKKNTWQGRRNTKRDLLKQKEEESLEFEKKVSLRLAEENQLRVQSNNDELSFKMTAYLLDTQGEQYLNLKFDLKDPSEAKNAHKMMNFTTVVHFLDTYLNSSYVKYFETYRKDN